MRPGREGPSFTSLVDQARALVFGEGTLEKVQYRERMSGSSSARQNAHLAGQEEVERLTDELEKVSAERERFRASNVSLTAECAQLRAANAKLQEKYDKLLQQVRRSDQKRSAPETQDDKVAQAEGQACLASGVLFSSQGIVVISTGTKGPKHVRKG